MLRSIALQRTFCATTPVSEILEFSPYGYDERQYCSPGFNLPVGCLMRSVWGTFPEYHTSADNLDFIRPEQLAESLRVCAADRGRAGKQSSVSQPESLLRTAIRANEIFIDPQAAKRSARRSTLACGCSIFPTGNTLCWILRKNRACLFPWFMTPQNFFLEAHCSRLFPKPSPVQVEKITASRRFIYQSKLIAHREPI